MSTTPIPPPVLTRSGETTPTVHSLSPKSSDDSLKKEQLNQIAVTLKSVEDGLEDIDGGWEGYMETELPEKGERKLLRNIRHHILNIYRRLFSIVFFVNLGVLISVAVRGATADYIGKIVIANIFVSVVIRDEHVCFPPFPIHITVWKLRFSFNTGREWVILHIYCCTKIVATVDASLHGESLQSWRK